MCERGGGNGDLETLEGIRCANGGFVLLARHECTQPLRHEESGRVLRGLRDVRGLTMEDRGRGGVEETLQSVASVA
jgi:hypothetical protein